MCFIFSLIPATILAVIAYFVLFSTSKAEGGIRWFGRVLATWVLVVALFFPIFGAYLTLTDQCPVGKFMHKVNRVLNR